MRRTLYATHDPSLASFFLSQGAVLAGHSRLGPKRIEFRFVADRALHLLRLYWSGAPVAVVPARLFDALRALKRRSLFLRDFSISPHHAHRCREVQIGLGRCPRTGGSRRR